MQPIDRFYYLKNNVISLDVTSLTQLYLPIMGGDAYMVYSYLVAFFDHGRAAHQFLEVLNHLQLGPDRLDQALDCLGALGLLNLYQQGEDYLIKLNRPLDKEAFLANPVYANLLKTHIGQLAFEELALVVPAGIKEVTKPFSALFKGQGEVYHRPQQAKASFDLAPFKSRMAKDGLTFEDEARAVLGLYRLADQHQLSWFDLYQVVKETAVQGRISLTRLEAALNRPQEVAGSGLTLAEQNGLKAARSHAPLVFLTLLKQDRKSVVTDQEKKALEALAQRGFLDEVINLMCLYTWQRTKSANLNLRYLTSMANDLSYKGIASGEAALAYWRQTPSKTAKPQAVQQTNVPDWSQSDYKNETSKEEQERLEAYKRQRLAELEREDL